MEWQVQGSLRIRFVGKYLYKLKSIVSQRQDGVSHTSFPLFPQTELDIRIIYPIMGFWFNLNAHQPTKHLL